MRNTRCTFMSRARADRLRPHVKRSAAVALVGSAAVLLACGSGAPDRVSPSRAQMRNVVAKEAGRFGASFLCARLPPGEAGVRLVVANNATKVAASRLMHHVGVEVRIEVRSIGEYNQGNLALADEIRGTRPAGIPASDVSYELYARQSRCPRVRIEVGARSQTDASVRSWVKAVVGHYGSDRVKVARPETATPV